MKQLVEVFKRGYHEAFNPPELVRFPTARILTNPITLTWWWRFKRRIWLYCSGVNCLSPVKWLTDHYAVATIEIINAKYFPPSRYEELVKAARWKRSQIMAGE